MVRLSLLPSGCTSGRGSSSTVALASAWGLLAALLPSAAPAAQPVDCAARASDACFLAMSPGQGKAMLHYYASLAEVAPTAAVATTAPPPAARPVRALIVMHGHPRDANKSFDAGLKAVSGAGLAADTLVVAPLFQVDAAQAGKCSTAGVPAASEGDLLWTCASWMAGAPASNDAAITSFGAMDALVAHLVDRWPSLRTITIAGFSAGAQMVQHYIGFAAAARVGDAAIRYVVSDPGTWLYFDAFRQSPPRFCAAVDRWKYGTEALPASLGRSATQARALYAAADIHYLEGELDTGSGRGTAYKVLDRSCAAMAQGDYRLDRGLNFAKYDRDLLAPSKHRQVTVVPGCAHDVACVLPAAAAREALFGNDRSHIGDTSDTTSATVRTQ